MEFGPEYKNSQGIILLLYSKLLKNIWDTGNSVDEPQRYYTKWNKPDPEGQIWFYLYEVPKVVKFIGTWSRMVLPGAGKRGEWGLIV